MFDILRKRERERKREAGFLTLWGAGYLQFCVPGPFLFHPLYFILLNISTPLFFPPYFPASSIPSLSSTRLHRPYCLQNPATNITTTDHANKDPTHAHMLSLKALCLSKACPPFLGLTSISYLT
jgi:hypothetical protein